MCSFTVDVIVPFLKQNYIWETLIFFWKKTFCVTSLFNTYSQDDLSEHPTFT